MMSRFQNDSNNHNSAYNRPFQNGCYKSRVLEPFIKLYELNICLLWQQRKEHLIKSSRTS